MSKSPSVSLSNSPSMSPSASPSLSPSPPEEIGDCCLFGSPTKFSGVEFAFLTNGVGGSYILEYWTGASWTALTTFTDTTGGFTTDGGIHFIVPTTWAKATYTPFNIPNVPSAIPMYWLRARVVVNPSVIPEVDYVGMVYAGSSCRGWYCGTASEELSGQLAWSSAKGFTPFYLHQSLDTPLVAEYDPTKRDSNNCYVYSSGSWETPLWSSGFQEIADRLKTAGTIAIINPSKPVVSVIIPSPSIPANSLWLAGTYDAATRYFWLDTTPASDPFIAGVDNDLPIAGDWNGTGLMTIGVFRPGTGIFHLSATNAGMLTTAAGNIHLTITGWQATDLPLVGDWTGTGKMSVGLYRPSTRQFMLKYAATSGTPDMTFRYGIVGDTPLAGDWDGDGVSTIGVWRSSDQTFHLRNVNTAGDATIEFSYGIAGDIPVVGDWDGDGIVTIGVYRPSNQTFYLRNSNSAGAPDLVVTFGNPDATPLVGAWQ
jgi:hypothetical protein